ncbi:hypothetical protein NVP2275O_299 [Vibrio phage 2.275.O._10N.286.54.E11]|nr:hypothetical protein NVP2275O_299 [Vibrio phage 2.275.O._10N.286.54.E11]
MAKSYVQIKYLTVSELDKLNDKRLVEVLKVARKHFKILEAGEFTVDEVASAETYHNQVKAISETRSNV